MADPFSPGLLHRIEEAPSKVAVICASRIGDFLCAVPAIRALRTALPGAQFTLIGLPLVAELAARSPHLDYFEPFPGYPGIAEQFFDARRTLDFFVRMQTENFGLAVQLHGTGVYSNPFALMLGARFTAGFVRQGDGPGRLDAALPMPAGQHALKRNLALAEFLGAPAQGEYGEFPLLPDDHAAAAALLAGAERPLIGLHPSARDAIKRWPPERFAAAGAELQRLCGGTLVVVGGPGDVEVAEMVSRQAGGNVLNVAGREPLGEMGAVIFRLDVLITNDSGPAHMAYALDTPSVTVFGGTSPGEWGPLDERIHRVIAYEVPCRPCNYQVCPIGYTCLQGVSVPEVVAAARDAIRVAGRLEPEPATAPAPVPLPGRSPA